MLQNKLTLTYQNVRIKKMILQIFFVSRESCGQFVLPGLEFSFVVHEGLFEPEIQLTV
jgi:hypothetical protein